MSRYFTILVPPAKDKATVWHAHDGKTLSRGAFLTETEAHAWAIRNIPGHAYSVVAIKEEV